MNIVVIPFSCFPFPFFNPLNRVFASVFMFFHSPFLITWTEFCFRFLYFPIPCSHHLNRVLAAVSMFSIPLFFSPLEQSFCFRFHVFCSSFFITWTEFCFRRFHKFFHFPFSSLEQSSCSCFPFSFFITSGLRLWIRVRSRFPPCLFADCFPFAYSTTRCGAEIALACSTTRASALGLQRYWSDKPEMCTCGEEKKELWVEAKSLCSFRFRDRQ